ncbi:MAG: sigma-54 dependent transcriptional regulator [Syntrophales bacterium]|jgi:two-component system response regulator PilR (NtrC family)|nr:sigma-54 dependent transcriptional regulator [Syntrophales bacterium]
MPKILVLDDDQNIRDMLVIMLTREGYDAQAYGDPYKAIQGLRKEPFDLIITDLKMPRMDGLEFLRRAKKIAPDTVVILITAYASGETAVAAMKEGAFDYIEKDFRIEDLTKIIERALDARSECSEDAMFRQGVADAVSFGAMIGSSPEMVKIYTVINKIADTPVNVLILGESGTGKELVAKAIHENSSRKGMPFTVINCGGIPESLLESELFGYMKGAFTGAHADKPGLFEVARGGTIFLDEIADLPPLLQVKLLRVTQEKTFRRVGGTEDIRVDVRIISATNKDLQQRVYEERFREDLYYRLNVIPIHIPPLRERKDDIPILTRYFIEKYSRQFGKKIQNISTYALELLVDYPFPGNIRELENIIERSIALEASSIILPENLVLSNSASRFEAPGDGIDIPPEGIHLNQELARVEKAYIDAALGKTNGSRKMAAELLNITLDSLHYRIDKLSDKSS